MSDNEDAGRLISIPGMVDTEATKPNRSLGAPRLVAYGFRTGLFDIVELKIANNPIKQRTRKYRSLKTIFPNRMG